MFIDTVYFFDDLIGGSRDRFFDTCIADLTDNDVDLFETYLDRYLGVFLFMKKRGFDTEVVEKIGAVDVDLFLEKLLDNDMCARHIVTSGRFREIAPFLSAPMVERLAQDRDALVALTENLPYLYDKPWVEVIMREIQKTIAQDREVLLAFMKSPAYLFFLLEPWVEPIMQEVQEHIVQDKEVLRCFIQALVYTQSEPWVDPIVHEVVLRSRNKHLLLENYSRCKDLFSTFPDDLIEKLAHDKKTLVACVREFG